MNTKKTIRTEVDKRELSRRSLLRLTGAGLATPVLQACGGGSSAPVAIPPSSASAPAPAPDPESVQWMRKGILEALGKADTTVSVALFADDRVVWSEAFGDANRETGVRATVDTRLNIGSVAKMVATLTVMILRDRRLLSLDQPLAQLMPAFSMRSPEYTQITVRQLINHSPGFPGSDYRNAFNFAPVPGYAQDTLEGLKVSRLKHDPGELSVYCNDGFTLVELLVPVLTSVSYTDFVQRELLDPLGMRQTEFPLKPAVEGTFVHPVLQGETLPQEMCACHASGSILSTPTDLMKLARLILDGGVFAGRRIVSEVALRDMAGAQAAYTRINLSAPSWNWGLGWDAVAQPGLAAGGLLAWKKGGDTNFFHCDFVVLPQARLAAMMIHDNQFTGDRTALVEGMLLRAAKERGAISALPAAIVPVVPPVAASVPDVSAYMGIYASEAAPIQVLAQPDGTLSIRIWNGKDWDIAAQGLRLRTDGQWWSDGVTNGSYGFSTVLGHRYVTRRELSVSGLYWNDAPAGEWLPEASAPLPAAWRDRLGTNWAGTNDDPASFEGRLAPRTGAMSELAERPGYVMWNNAQLLRVIDDDEAGMTVKVPVLQGRDLIEIRMEGEEQLHIGTLVYRRSG
jgi:CubicO group peptidase (beta-lactamase class C family)